MNKALCILKSHKGETLVETLVTLVIAVLALTMLPMSIVVASRINNRVAVEKSFRTVEDRDVAAELTNAVMKVNDTGFEKVKIYRDDAGYIFYEYSE